MATLAQASQPLGEKIKEVSLKLEYSHGTEGEAIVGLKHSGSSQE